MDHREEVLRILKIYEERFKDKSNTDLYEVAICKVQLKDFVEARQLFEKSCIGMLKTKPWIITGDTGLLVDVCTLSGQVNLRSKVLEELETYSKSDRRGNSPVALYSYVLMAFLTLSKNDVIAWIQGLLRKPKFEDTFTMGEAFQALLKKDQPALTAALDRLLKIHKGMAKHGELRQTAEGLLSMPVMSIAYVALQNDFSIDIKDDYFSIEYLNFLMNYDSPREKRSFWQKLNKFC